MSCENTPGNAFRLAVLGGGPELPILAKKSGKRLSSDSLEAVEVPRNEVRCTDQRSGDREVCARQTVVLRKGRSNSNVALVNLSGGGAMVEGDLRAQLWDKVTLVLGEHGEVECAVRWIRKNRFGLEFAHETRIDCATALRDETLRQVLEENFADAAANDEPALEADSVAADEPPVSSWLGNRQSARHPLIWSGMIHQDRDSCVARLRNISANGAMIQSSAQFSPDTEVVLDLGNAGTIPARVSWAFGDQAGLKFAEEFDIQRLAACKPEVASSKWAKPDYLRDESIETSPWASQWGRLSVKDLGRTLAG